VGARSFSPLSFSQVGDLSRLLIDKPRSCYTPRLVFCASTMLIAWPLNFAEFILIRVENDFIAVFADEVIQSVALCFVECIPHEAFFNEGLNVRG